MVPHHSNAPWRDQNRGNHCAAFLLEGMRTTVLDACKKCDICQRKVLKYGKLPPKSNVEQVPWHTLCVDLIGR
jgi:hypothetical protein